MEAWSASALSPARPYLLAQVMEELVERRIRPHGADSSHLRLVWGLHHRGSLQRHLTSRETRTVPLRLLRRQPRGERRERQSDQHPLLNAFQEMEAPWTDSDERGYLVDAYACSPTDRVHTSQVGADHLAARARRAFP